MKKIFMAALVLGLILLGGNSYANLISVGQYATITDPGTNNTNGGAFIISGPSGTFASFCIELTETFNPGGSYYVNDISYQVIGEGHGAPYSNLSHGAAGLYAQYIATYGLGGTNNSTINDNYQTAIWAWEGEIAYSSLTADAKNLYDKFLNASGYYGVEVINFKTSPTGSNTQSMLVINAVPEPATMLLLGFGLIGLAGFARKKLA